MTPNFNLKIPNGKTLKKNENTQTSGLINSCKNLGSTNQDIK